MYLGSVGVGFVLIGCVDGVYVKRVWGGVGMMRVCT